MVEHDHHASSGSRIFTVIAGILFFVFSFGLFLQQYLLKNYSTLIQAKVLRTQAVRRKGSIAYYVDYAFDLGNRRFEGNGLVKEQTFYNLIPGSPLPIRYVQSDPNMSETVEMSHNRTGMMLPVFLGFPVSLGMIFWPLIRKKDPLSEIAKEEVPPVPDSSVPLPPTVEGIAFTVYPVKDIQRSRMFYENTLGLHMSREFQGKWVEYHLWDNCFAITTMMDGVEPGKDGGKIGLEVNDIDRFVSDLRAKGVSIKIEPFSTPGCRMAVILDPDGNGLTLHHKLS